jgi:hypothetical protein
VGSLDRTFVEWGQRATAIAICRYIDVQNLDQNRADGGRDAIRACVEFDAKDHLRRFRDDPD